MIGWAFICLILGTFAAVYGYTSPPSTSTYIAKLFFLSLLSIFVLLIIFSLFSTSPPPPEHSKLPI